MVNLKTNKKIATEIAVISLAIILYSSLTFASATSLSIPNGPVTNVSMTEYSFTPSDILIGAPNSTSGEFATVVWTNNGVVNHTVTSGNGSTGTPDGLFDSGNLAPGQTFTLEVNQTMYASILAKYPDGVVPYYCSVHFTLAMVGSLTVSSTPVPEFSMPTLLLTFALTLAVLFYAARFKGHKVRSS